MTASPLPAARPGLRAVPHSRIVHARRHQQGHHVRRARPARGHCSVGRDLPARDGQSRSVRPAARRHGRRALVALQGVRDRARRRDPAPTSTTPSRRSASTSRASITAATAGTCRPRWGLSRSIAVSCRSRATRRGCASTTPTRASSSTPCFRCATDATRATAISRFPGVAGTGAPIRLEFLQPGGASTGALLPTGHARDVLAVPGHGEFEVSMVDAANACVFVAGEVARTRGHGDAGRARSQHRRCSRPLDAIRVQAAIAMGLARNAEEARARKAVPFVGFVAPRAGQSHARGRGDPGRRGRSRRAHAVVGAAASGAAADRLAVHGGGGADRRQRRASRGAQRERRRACVSPRRRA